MEAKQLYYVPMLIPLLIFLLLGGASLALADDDLPACGDYTEPVLWFEIDEFGETITGFEEVYTNAKELAECTAFVDGNIVLIDCGEWETSLTWLRTQQPLPFEDDQPVLAWAHVYDHDATSGYLFLLDENEDVILMHSNTGIPDEENTPFFIDGEMDLTSQDVCEYKASALQPGYQNPNVNWEYVYGTSFGGTFDAGSFQELWPTQWATTQDGRYDIFNAISYWGEDEFDVAQKVLIQIVPGTTLADDDDDSADDDIIDDDDADDDDDAAPDADDDDDDNDSGGCS